MNSWENVKIGSICKIKGGKRLPKDHYVCDEDTGYPYLRVSDLSADGFSDSDLKYITKEVFSKIKNYTISADDVYISITGTIGHIGRVPSNYDGISLTENCAKFTQISSNIDTDYLMYFLRSPYGRDQIDSMTGGASQPKLALTRIAQIITPLPPFPTQQKIAKILSNYDDLIENNLKCIKLLEESTRLTYEDWFLRFRIDGKKLDIDKTTGLPFGWEWKVIKDFGKVVTGKTPSTQIENFYGGDILFVKTPSMHNTPYVLEAEDYLSEEGARSQASKFIPKNSLMISCIGTVGVYSLAATDCQTNQQINSIMFYKDEYTFYVYGFAGYLKEKLEALGSSGATMTNVNKEKFENMKLAMPNIDLLKRYHNLYSPNFKSILNLMKQNQLLKEARDILLPRLMTGMIDTDDMDIAV